LLKLEGAKFVADVEAITQVRSEDLPRPVICCRLCGLDRASCSRDYGRPPVQAGSDELALLAPDLAQMKVLVLYVADEHRQADGRIHILP
jgi:hypothetical protein